MRKILFTEREKATARLILEILGAGVMLSTALVAPNATGLVGKTILQLDERPRRTKSRTLYDLKRRGYVRAYHNDEGSWLALSKKGKVRLQKYRLEALTIKRPRVWDGNWRIIFFDIPRKPPALNRSRDVFRGMLKRLGFSNLQKSVWVHPFPCGEEVAYVAEVYGLQPYIRVAVAQSVTSEEQLRKQFDL